MSVRLPSADGYRLQVEKEQHWLPILAPLLPLPIPSPIAAGAPGDGYPWQWSIYEWIDGESASAGSIRDLEEFAADLASFLVVLRGVDAADGPAPGPHNFFRGAPLGVYDADTQRALTELGDSIDRNAATEVWDAALGTNWSAAAVWFHGDIATGNLLLRDGKLSAVIDFGTSGVGDPACDLAIAFTLFTGRSRGVFRERIDLDFDTWARGRGWALWKALVTAAGFVDTRSPSEFAEARRVIAEVTADHRQAGATAA
jgi:aminoglycoside phosphotransferase (APT) family kinase protein